MALRASLLFGCCLGLASAFSLPRASHSSVGTRRHLSPVMIRPTGNSDPNFDESAISDEAKRRTITRTAIVWGVVGSIGAAASMGGKSIGLANAPGVAEAQAKKAAEKAAYLASLKEREGLLKEKAAADKAAGRSQSAPPRPWER